MWEELKTARENKSLTQVKLGQLTGISGAAISAWENQMPAPFEKLKRLAEELDSSPNALLGYEVSKDKATSKDLRGGAILVGEFLNRDDLSTISVLLANYESLLRQNLMKGRINDLEVSLINDAFDLRTKINGALYQEEGD